MKRISEKTLTNCQKQNVTHYLENFITKVFTTPLQNKTELLLRLTTFAKDNSGGELI